MRIVKELVGVEGEGFQKILNYQRCMDTKKKDVEGTYTAFDCVKVYLLNKDYKQAVSVLESLYMERIPNDFIQKISKFNNEEAINMCDSWKQDFIKMGEQGFVSLVYSRLRSDVE